MDGRTHRLRQQVERLRCAREAGKLGGGQSTSTTQAEPLPGAELPLIDLLRKELGDSARKARCWSRQANRFTSIGADSAEGWSLESGRLSPQVSDIKVELDLGHAVHWKAIRNAMRLFVVLRAQVAEKDALTAELRQKLHETPLSDGQVKALVQQISSDDKVVVRREAAKPASVPAAAAQPEVQGFVLEGSEELMGPLLSIPEGDNEDGSGSSMREMSDESGSDLEVSSPSPPRLAKVADAPGDVSGEDSGVELLSSIASPCTPAATAIVLDSPDSGYRGEKTFSWHGSLDRAAEPREEEEEIRL
mmetsp:Transcript_68041/g.127073  ORF Transcript_68041/g.127073 Transcript_68041/m.127073 type:complete len:305 (+) Transcript_68041:117-1031(+)